MKNNVEQIGHVLLKMAIQIKMQNIWKAFAWSSFKRRSVTPKINVKSCNMIVTSWEDPV